MKFLKIYVASSWRNFHQPDVVIALRRDGHTVYDFRNPGPENIGFQWSEIDPKWKSWSLGEYAKALDHPIAQAGYNLDMRGLVGADLCVLVLPSGRSASWEYGYHNALTRRSGIVYCPEKVEPELMYRGSRFVSTLADLVAVTREYADACRLVEDFR